ncbi:rCG52368 [Rattus norvegicus]|uniref:RCG52368 n=1 Tax=Rattus norvegicus TaxID=10116 RepID=A6K110_RAT|nr:rCG52368 [Rattus norvegicus]
MWPKLDSKFLKMKEF